MPNSSQLGNIFAFLFLLWTSNHKNRLDWKKHTIWNFTCFLVTHFLLFPTWIPIRNSVAFTIGQIFKDDFYVVLGVYLFDIVFKLCCSYIDVFYIIQKKNEMIWTTLVMKIIDMRICSALHSTLVHEYSRQSWVSFIWTSGFSPKYHFCSLVGSRTLPWVH